MKKIKNKDLLIFYIVFLIVFLFSTLWIIKGYIEYISSLLALVIGFNNYYITNLNIEKVNKNNFYINFIKMGIKFFIIFLGFIILYIMCINLSIDNSYVMLAYGINIVLMNYNLILSFIFKGDVKKW